MSYRADDKPNNLNRRDTNCHEIEMWNEDKSLHQRVKKVSFDASHILKGKNVKQTKKVENNVKNSDSQK